MSRNSSNGIFIAIEGPNGVGKTTLVESIRSHLCAVGCDVLTTKEPTESELGRWIRRNQDEVRGKPLACLIAANRYEHIESVIQPALERNKVVLTDRYLASSFVYQISDGVHHDFVWAVNSQCLAADLTICFLAGPDSISKRMTGRSALTRFEQSISPEKETSLYRQACECLRRNGWPVEVFDNEDGLADQIATEVAEKIVHLRNRSHV